MRRGKADRLTYLYTQYINGLCTETELQEFFELVNDPEMKECLQELADKHLENIRPNTLSSAIDWDYMYNSIMQSDPASAADTNKQRPVRWLFTRWGKMAAAAIILVMLAGGTLLFFYNKQGPAGLAGNSRYKNDIPPGGNKAVLTLSNGVTVPLHEEGTRSLDHAQYINVFKLDSIQLTYNTKARGVGYHTLSTPRGGQFRLVLPDGSKVWLNAASSITYPITFSGKDRKVAISGEVYLEVAKDAAKPFKVAVNGMEVTVLGTRFNINAYSDEQAVLTTLLDGAVKVKCGGSSRQLQPGQQLQLWPGNDVRLITAADTATVTAWKDGLFSFNDDDISAIMRQVQRWYNAEVVYEDKAPQHFVGTIPRDVPVSKLLTMLELTGRLRFKIEGRKITVMQPFNQIDQQ